MLLLLGNVKGMFECLPESTVFIKALQDWTLHGHFIVNVFLVYEHYLQSVVLLFF
jgi:hypothetical protein